jgi:hypothetical protein
VATGQPLSKVGAALGGLLPNIISKPLGLEVVDAEFDAQMAEVERVLRLGPAGDAGPPDLPTREGARP